MKYFFDSLSLCLYSLEKRVFFFKSRKSWRILPEITKIWGFTLIFVSRVKKVLFSILHKNKIKIGQIFDRNHGLSPLEKCKFCDILLSLFLDSTISLVFYQECHQTPLLKIKHERLFKFFLLKPWTNPFVIM